MKPKQLYFMLIASLVVLGLGFVGVSYGAEKLFEGQSNKLATLKAKAQALDNQENKLVKNKRDIAKYSNLNAIAKSIVPQDKDQAEAVREIVSLANQSGIAKLSSITFPASTLGSLVPGKSAGAATSGSLTQVMPVPGIKGVYNLQITITQDSQSKIQYSQFTTFLQKLEQNRRTAQVSSISVQPDTKNPNLVSFTLTIDEFVKP